MIVYCSVIFFFTIEATALLCHYLYVDNDSCVYVTCLGASGWPEISRLNWSDAIDKAAGAKGTEDPRKLKKALKRIDNKKMKSSREWRERLESVLTLIHISEHTQLRRISYALYCL